MLVMPVWSKAELDLCHARLYPDFDKQRMDGLYNKYGGVPHNVLEYPSVNPEVLDLHELNYGLRALLAISTEEVSSDVLIGVGVIVVEVVILVAAMCPAVRGGAAMAHKTPIRPAP